MLHRHLPHVKRSILLLRLEKAPPGAGHHRAVRPLRERVAGSLKGQERHRRRRELVLLRAAVVIGACQAPEPILLILLLLEPVERKRHGEFGHVAASRRAQ